MILHYNRGNNELGKIRIEQKAGNWQVWQTSLHNPNFAGYATTSGAKGIGVRKKEDLEKGLMQALNAKALAWLKFFRIKR